MSFSVCLQLLTSSEQYEELAEMHARMREACNWLSQIACDADAYCLRRLQALGRTACVNELGLPKAHADCCVHTVAAVYRKLFKRYKVQVFEPTFPISVPAMFVKYAVDMVSVDTLRGGGGMRVQYEEMSFASIYALKLATKRGDSLCATALSLVDGAAVLTAVFKGSLLTGRGKKVW